VADLLQQDEWPTTLAETFYAGNLLVPTAEPSEALLAALQVRVFDEPLLLSIYSLTGPRITDVQASSAYGGRDAKWVIHWKHVWSNADTAAGGRYVSHARSLARELGAAVPWCKSFYNYAADSYLPCAADRDEWFAAHFSDVPRLRRLKLQHLS